MSVIVKNVRLSENPEATTMENEEGINGMVNETSDGRAYVVVELEDTTNPFKMTRRTLTYSQNNDKWPGATPKQLLDFKGKELPGAKTVTETVEPYEIGENTVSTYSTILLPHENKYTTFSNLDHPIIDVETGEVITASGVSQPQSVSLP
jgi:hypothetical protein